MKYCNNRLKVTRRETRLQFETLESRIALAVDVSGYVYWDANRNGLDDDPSVTHESVSVSVVGDDDAGGSMDVNFTGGQANYSVSGIVDETFDPNATIFFEAADVEAVPSSGFELTYPLVSKSMSTDSYNTLSNIPITKPSWVETADVDGQNGPDLLVANFAQPRLTVMLNDGTGQFPAGSRHEIPVPANVTSIDQADFDGDGDVDLVVGNLNSKFLTILENDGTGTYTSSGSQISLTSGAPGPFSVIATDINADGAPDIVSSDFWGNQLSVYLNQSTPTGVSFASVSSIEAGSGSVTVVAAKMNTQEGLPGLVVLNSRDDVLLIFDNDGAGGFSFSGNTVPAMDADFVVSGRIDGDEFDDLALYSQSGQRVFVYFGDGAGGFTDLRDPQTEWYPRGIALGDIDADGDTDLVANLIDGFGIAILRNEGGRQISDELPIFEVPLDPIVASPPALADFDRDGVVDIARAPEWLGGSVEVSFRQLEKGSQIVRTDEGNVSGRNFGVARIVSSSSTLGGDYDGDGTVDGMDLAVWTANHGKTAGPGMSADGNLSGRVDGIDFLAWQRSFGNAVAASAGVNEASSYVSEQSEQTVFPVEALVVATRQPYSPAKRAAARQSLFEPADEYFSLAGTQNQNLLPWTAEPLSAHSVSYSPERQVLSEQLELEVEWTIADMLSEDRYAFEE